MSARPLASLSSGLLARPGSATPAMRRQGYDFAQAEDLGWNDMGSPAAPVATPVPVAVPPVLTERAKLANAVTPRPRTDPAPQPASHKAAFTLRLDPDRHLRLRLASAVAGRSSQQLLVAALDAYLETHPQVDALARQVPESSKTHHFSGEKK